MGIMGEGRRRGMRKGREWRKIYNSIIKGGKDVTQGIWFKLLRTVTLQLKIVLIFFTQESTN